MRLESADIEDLLACWLNELVFLVQHRGFVPARIAISRLSAGGLEASLVGRRAARLPLQAEIKSATRHGLSVQKTRLGWRATALLDV